MSSGSIDVRFFDLILCVSRALDLLSLDLSDHHMRVAYVAARIADALGLPVQDRQDAVLAGALHDVGAVSGTLRLSLQNYAVAGDIPLDATLEESVHTHAIEGYLLLRDFPPFARAAEAVRYHHVEWNYRRGSEFNNAAVPLLSHVLHLADRVAVLPRPRGDILEQSADIRRKVVDDAGRRYHPQAVAAFTHASRSESFWLDLVSPHKEEIIRCGFDGQNVALDLDELYELARLFARIIDFRSPYTAIHSSTVAAKAERIAQLLHIDPVKTRLIGTAGFLHDLGKLAVPAEILDKPGKLTPQEMRIIKQHPYYTHRILSQVPGLEEINTYASLHHERLDGHGYPFRKQTIPQGARIIAVADVFTAISEQRPYRAGMTRQAAIALLNRFVDEGALDGDIVALVRTHFDDIQNYTGS